MLIHITDADWRESPYGLHAMEEQVYIDPESVGQVYMTSQSTTRVVVRLKDGKEFNFFPHYTKAKEFADYVAEKLNTELKKLEEYDRDEIQKKMDRLRRTQSITAKLIQELQSKCPHKRKHHKLFGESLSYQSYCIRCCDCGLWIQNDTYFANGNPVEQREWTTEE
jgi:hypothetical protein